MDEIMITTVDNPWNPFTHFDDWNAWDMQAGYHTMAFLARLVKTSHELSEAQQMADIDAAIDEIARENVSGVHRKVTASQAAALLAS